jgi:hypothetical protein
VSKHTRKGKTGGFESHSHMDARVVMVRPLRITAGGSLSHAPIQAARLFMAGNPKPVIEGLPGYTPIMIRLDWPDMSTPDMSASDWRWLVGRIRGLHRPLHVSCAMGHGRTGTCLAILAHFLGAIPRRADPVQWVRDAYCQDSIETGAQIAYIERITGRPSTCKPAMPVMVTGGDWGGYPGPGTWSQTHGWTPSGAQRTYESALPAKSTGSALDDVMDMGYTPGKGYVGMRIRYCGHTEPGTRMLCPKPARDGSNLCDKHYFDSLPSAAKTLPPAPPTNPDKGGA